MFRFLLDNAPSSHPSDAPTAPCFILPESSVSVLYTDTRYEKDFRSEMNVNENFLKVLTASAACWRQSAALIGQLSPPPSVGTCLSKLTHWFSLEIIYITKFILISAKLPKLLIHYI